MRLMTKEKMIAHAQTLRPSADRAQCYQIANLTAGESIAKAIVNDHTSISAAKRAARLMVDAGCATEGSSEEGYYGVFTFEDGSQL